MNRWSIVGLTVLLYVGLQVVLVALGGSPLADQVIRAVAALTVSLGFAVRLGRLTEVRWGILLAIVFIFSFFLRWMNDFLLIGYFFWAGCRLSEQAAKANDNDETRGKGQLAGDFFVRIRLWELALWMGLSMVVGLVAGMWSGWLWLADDKLGVRVFYFVADGLTAFWLFRKLERSGVDLDRFTGGWPKGRLIGEGLLMVAVLIMFNDAINTGLIFGIAGFDRGLAENVLRSFDWKPMMGEWWLEECLAGVLMAPILEEMIFRGVVLRRLAVIWGNTAAIVTSSLVFGLLHGWEEAAAITVSGIGLAVMYTRSRTLVVPIIMHMANNLFAFWTAVYYPEWTATSLEQLKAGMPWHIACAVVAVPVLAVYFYKFWPRGEEAWPRL